MASGGRRRITLPIAAAREDHYPRLVTGQGDAAGQLRVGLEGPGPDELHRQHGPSSPDITDFEMRPLQRTRGGR